MTMKSIRTQLADFEGIPYRESGDLNAQPAPDYFNDLNAIYRIENKLTKEQRIDYAMELFWETSAEGEENTQLETFAVAHASAEHRINALMEILGIEL